jgi:hypothetical protein
MSGLEGVLVGDVVSVTEVTVESELIMGMAFAG